MGRKKTQKEKVEEMETYQWEIAKPSDISQMPRPTEGLVRDKYGRITVGSKGLNTRYSLQEVEERFLVALDACYQGDVLSVQEAQVISGLLPSTFYRYAKDYKHLGELKEAMNAAIAAHINRKAINGELQPIVSIFRMKVLGERDRDDNTKNDNNNEQPIIDLNNFS